MIYFDITRVLEWSGRYTGMERVAYEFAENLKKNVDRIAFVYFVPSFGFVDVSEYITWENGELKSSLTRNAPIRVLMKKNPLHAAREILKRERNKSTYRKLPQIDFGDENIFFTTDGLWDNQDYINEIVKIGKSPVKVIHLVHDMVPIVMPHVVHDYVTNAIRGYFDTVAPYIDVLVSISQNTQKDFIRTFGSHLHKGVRKIVVRHGEDFSGVASVRPSLLSGINKFLLCVGTVEIRKNHLLIYQAYKLADEQGIDLPPIVIVGRQGWLCEQTVKLMKDDPAMSSKIIFAGPLPDAELAWCYENCIFTTLPSLYEGWGLQVAESLHYGKVCVTANSGPLPEVGGDLNVYFSPFNPYEYLQKLLLPLDGSLRVKMEKKIKAEYKTTTWSDTVQTVLKAL